MYESTKPDLSWQCFAYSLHFSSAIIYRNILCRHCYIWQTERWTTLLDGSETSSHLLPFSLPLSVNVDREGPKRKDTLHWQGTENSFKEEFVYPGISVPLLPLYSTFCQDMTVFVLVAWVELCKLKPWEELKVGNWTPHLLLPVLTKYVSWRISILHLQAVDVLSSV